MKVGLVGLGRIGRHMLRFVLDEFVDIEFYFYDLNGNLHNIVYLLNYDSVYGLRSERFEVREGDMIYDTSSKSAVVYCNLDEFTNLDLDFVIDCSGSANVFSYLSEQGIKTYVTHAPASDLVDEYIIANVSDKSQGRIVSTSICDTTAIAPVVKFVDETIGFSNAHLVTLHPWLGYQNLTDNSVISIDTPAHYHEDFALGRKSSEAMIPKSTSAIAALGKVLPNLAEKFSSFSFRVPTPIVSSALLNFNLHNVDITPEEFLDQVSQVNGVKISRPNLISSDFIGLNANCAVDQKSVQLNGDILSLVLWYDNELGYVASAAQYIMKEQI